MARFSALAVVSQSIAALLSEASLRDEFPTADYPVIWSGVIASTASTGSADAPPALGVTIFPYRVAYNAQRRPSAPRVLLTGERFRPSVLLDLHFIVTAWASDAIQQMRLLAWAARTLEDTPVLTPGLLNRWGPAGEEVFGSTESVEIVSEPLSAQELVAIWEINKPRQQPSLGYVVRMIAIDSDVSLPEQGIVRTRTFDHGLIVQ